MPHIQIDYSSNIEQHVDISELVETLRKEACLIDAFPMAGIRVRATSVDYFAIADGHSKHGFIDISVRLREGRSEDVKKDAIHQLFEALKEYMSPALAKHSIAISAEIRDINANLSPKFSTIRDHLGDSHGNTE